MAGDEESHRDICSGAIRHSEMPINPITTKSLSDLATELHDLICRHSETKEVKALRLTSRSLCESATKHFLPEIVVFYTLHSINSASWLTNRRPDLAAEIKSLRFQADRLPDFQKFGAWNSAFKFSEVGSNNTVVRRLRPSISGGDHSESILLSLDGLRSVYRRMRSEQKLLDTIDPRLGVQQVLSQLFRACHKLTSIHFTTARSFVVQNWGSWNTKHALVPIVNDDIKLSEGVHALTKLVRAVNDAERKITELTVIDVSFRVFTQPAAAMADVCNIAANLQILRWKFLRCYGDGDNDPEMESALLSSFRAFFGQAKNLRVLDLEVSIDDEDREILSLALIDLFEELVCPKLEKLSLTNMWQSGAALSSFLLSHKDTLTSIVLEKIVVADYTGTGHDLIRGLLRALAGKLEQLATARFEEVGQLSPRESFSVDTKDAELMANYLRDGGDELPECLKAEYI